MAKLILSIKTRNKSFNLLEQMYKDFWGGIPSQIYCCFSRKLYKGES